MQSILFAPLVFSALAMTDISSNVAPDILIGEVRATDGDSLRMGDKRIRLFGIDAPESAQKCQLNGEEWACGRASRRALERLTKGHAVRCEIKDMDRGRFVSACRTQEGDLGEQMVRRGWAVTYTQYSLRYVSAEIQARADSLALWRSEFERPHEYRARKRREVASRPAQTPPNAGCSIKGNISRAGERVFHVPGQVDYSRTRINVDNGERWFCSAHEALEAGWRAARR